MFVRSVVPTGLLQLLPLHLRKGSQGKALVQARLTDVCSQFTKPYGTEGPDSQVSTSRNIIFEPLFTTMLEAAGANVHGARSRFPSCFATVCWAIRQGFWELRSPKERMGLPCLISISIFRAAHRAQD